MNDKVCRWLLAFLKVKLILVIIRVYILIFVGLLPFFSAQAIENVNHNFKKSTPLSNQTCISCHEQSQHDWQQSDHAKSMAVANKASVLADFNNTDVEHYGQKAHFLSKVKAIKRPFPMRIKQSLIRSNIPLVISHYSNI